MKNLGGSMQLFNLSIINETTTEGLTPCQEFNPSVRVFFIVAYSLVFLVGLLLNGFILKFLFCQRQKSSRSIMVYLKNLAAADFMLSLSLPFYIMHSAINSVNILRLYCKFGYGIFYLNMYTSILFMTYTAYNRYLKIVCSNKTHILQTVRGACIISIFTWVFMLTVGVTYVSVAFTTKRNLTSISNHCPDLHSTQFSVFTKVRSAFMSTIFMAFLMFIVFIYNRTSHKVSVVQQSQVTSSNCKKLAKSRRNMRVLVSVFCICFTPFHLVNVFQNFLECSWSPVFNFMHELTRVLSAVNICLDPFIYFIFCKDFQEQLRLKNVFFLRRDTPDLNMERRPQNEAEPSIQSNSDSS
ncbi:P2Y purinoceptor 14-like [Sphaeramia orbicularis]|uniref:P2Y purinoceptor 14-like n=1 Tax=Sphaeramia orbicularis TaxID=375764 RepID=UPI00117D63D0|nr:P2Y purinoceptor 14-like [Sphaeramia orbicularis]